MLSFDTNIAVYAAHAGAPQHAAARQFLLGLAGRRDVVICDLMLVELYLKLRNPKILAKPMDAARAAKECSAYRENRVWTLVECAQVMDRVWKMAAAPGFAYRRIVDVRLALTLRHCGVTEFATSNLKDFEGLGFARVWNPLQER